MQSITAREKKRQREMNGKLREELAIKYSNFNDELPTNTRKVEKAATNINYYVFSPYSGAWPPLTVFGRYAQIHHTR